MRQIFSLSLVLFILLIFTEAAKADCDLSPKFGYATKGKVLSFKNQSKGVFTSVEWNFGDGQVSKDKHPKHEYKEGGMYTFSLTISNEEGCSETYEGKVYIFDLKNKGIKSETQPADNKETSEEVVADQNSQDNDAQEVAKNEPSLQNLGAFHNYPNPFTDATTISFDLEKSNMVKIMVYNLNGQLVELLSDDFMNQGKQQIVFRRKDLPSGQYVITAMVENEAFSHQMTIQ